MCKIKYISQLNLYNCTLLPIESWVLTENNSSVVVFIPEWWLLPTTTTSVAITLVVSKKKIKITHSLSVRRSLKAFCFSSNNISFDYLTTCSLQAMNCWTQPQDCFYPVLLDQYLTYFLRSDGRAVPPIPVTSSTPSPTANRLSPYR